MSTPNTLSFLIQFKTDLGVLDKTVGWLEKAQKRVQEYNAQMQNGTRAINAGLQAAAGLFAVGAVKSYVAEAVEMRKAQGQLDQALRQSGKYSAEYSKALAEQADALETATGVDSTRVAAVQRELVLAGVRKQDLAELTALTLDYAAAREIEAGAAAKLVGQTLRGEGDSIRGLGVELDLSKGRVEALKTAFAQFKGQAVEAIAALPPELRAFEKASDDAKKAAGQFVLEISGPALDGFAKGLKQTEEWLQRISGTGSTTASVLRSVSSVLGEYVGKHVSGLIAMAGAFVAIKGSVYLLNQAMVMLGATWVYVAGTQFLPLLADIQAFSRELGILQTLCNTGWQPKAATGIAAFFAAVAGYQAGKVVGRWVGGPSLEETSTAIDDQTMAILKQAEAAKTLQEIEAARARTQKELAETAKQVASLEAKKNAQVPVSGLALAAAAGPYAQTITAGATATAGLGPTDTVTLARLRQRQIALAAVANTMADPAWQQRQIKANKPQSERDAEVLRAELVRKKELLQLENQLIAAQSERNQPEIDRLQRLIEEKKLQEDLKGFGTEAAALVQSRLTVEDQARAKARKELLDNYDLATQQTLAELAANRAEQDRLALLEYEKKARIEIAALGLSAGENEARVQARLQSEKDRLARESALVVLKAKATSAEAELARVEQQRSNITSNTLLDETTKRRRLTENTEEYRKVLARVLELKLQERKLAVDAAEQATLDAEIARLQASADTYGLSDLQPSKIQATRNAYADRNNPESHYQSTGEGMAGGAMEFAAGLGTMGDSAAAAVTGTLNQALTSTADILDGLIWRSGSFKDLWNNAVLAVEKQFTRMAMEMVTKMIWRSTVERGLLALGVSLNGAAEAQKTTATVAGAATRGAAATVEGGKELAVTAVKAGGSVASTPWVGPVLAIAAIAAILAFGSKLFGGHKDGGIIYGPGSGTSDSILTRLSNGEGVIPAHRVQQYGPDFINSIIAGTYLADNATAALAARGSALQAATAAPLVAAAPVAGTAATAKPQDISLAIFDNATSASDYLKSRGGRRALANRQRQAVEDLG